MGNQVKYINPDGTFTEDCTDNSIGYATVFLYHGLNPDEKSNPKLKFVEINSIGYFAITIKVTFNSSSKHSNRSMTRKIEVDVMSVHDDLDSIGMGNEKFNTVIRNIINKIESIKKKTISIPELVEYTIPLLLFAKRIDTAVRTEIDNLAGQSSYSDD